MATLPDGNETDQHEHCLLLAGLVNAKQHSSGTEE